MLRKAIMLMALSRKTVAAIVVATAVGIGGTALSTAALARGGGFGGGHFAGGGHFGGGFHAGRMAGGFGGFHAGHEHGGFRHGFGGYGYLPYDCQYPYRHTYPECY